MLSPDDVLELLAVELIGLIPEDEHVVMSTNQGVPIVLNGKSKAGQAFRDVASRLKGEDIPFLPLEDEKGLFKRLSRLIHPGGS